MISLYQGRDHLVTVQTLQYCLTQEVCGLWEPQTEPPQLCHGSLRLHRKLGWSGQIGEGRPGRLCPALPQKDPFLLFETGSHTIVQASPELTL